jgi:hypothetical protein
MGRFIKNNHGDIFEMKTSKGLAYFQFILENLTFGEMIRIIPGRFEDRPVDFEALVAADGGWTCFFPVAESVLHGQLECVAAQPLPPEFRIPESYKVAGASNAQGQTLNWWIITDGKAGRVEVLSKDQSEFPVPALYSFEDLKARLEKES